MADKFRILGSISLRRASLALAALSLGSVSLFAEKAAGTSLSQAQTVGARGGAVRSFTDLDGDLLRDSVRSSSSGLDRAGYIYTVEFEMSAGAFSPPIRVHGPDAWGLNITARDVDGDRDLDLVVTGGAFGRPLGVWINDGSGHFAPAEISDFPSWIWLEELSIHAPSLRNTGDAAVVLTNSISVARASDTHGDPLHAGALLLRGVDSPLWDHFFTYGSRPRAPPSSQLAS